MTPTSVIFFGSTTDSALVLQKLFTYPDVVLSAVVTQPPRPIGRKQIITPTPIETWAKEHTIPFLSFVSSEKNPARYADDERVIASLQPFKADLLVSASYGQKIPMQVIGNTKFGGLNVHPSILPRWRGADPVPWAILTGDHQIGVTIVSISENFDSGRIFAQKKIPLLDTDTTDPLRAKLFTLGGELLIATLPDYISGKNKGVPQDLPAQAGKTAPYAKRLTREDGFEPWEAIQKAFTDEAEAKRIDSKFRAFVPWPGVWT